LKEQTFPVLSRKLARNIFHGLGELTDKESILSEESPKQWWSVPCCSPIVSQKPPPTRRFCPNRLDGRCLGRPRARGPRSGRRERRRRLTASSRVPLYRRHGPPGSHTVLPTRLDRGQTAGDLTIKP
jgi:hypothetical protein